MTKISSATHSLTVHNTIRGLSLVEITEDDATQQNNHRFYVVAEDRDQHQCRSIIPADCPSQRGCQWIANMTPGGVAYVANPRTRATARRWFTRLATDDE